MIPSTKSKSRLGAKQIFGWWAICPHARPSPPPLLPDDEFIDIAEAMGLVLEIPCRTELAQPG